MDGGNVDLQLSDDPYDSKLLKVGTAPLLVSTIKKKIRIKYTNAIKKGNE